MNKLIEIMPSKELQYLEMKTYINNLTNDYDNIKEKTKIEYINDYLTINRNGIKLEDLIIRKPSYYKYRAAYLYANITQAKIQINFIDKEDDELIKTKKIKVLSEIINDIEQYTTNSEIVKSAYFKSNPQKSLSKKWQLTTLKKTWSDLMFDKLSFDNSIYLSAVAVMFCTGCRPDELTTGITMSKKKDGIAFKVFGKKTHFNNKFGQEVREYTVFIDDKHYYHLLNLLKDEDSITIKIASARLISTQIRRNSKIILANETSLISAYSYRHNFSNILKKSGIDTDDIARCLGHCNDKSQNYYAHAQNKASSRRFKISDISATRPIKHVINNSFINNKTTSAPVMFS